MNIIDTHNLKKTYLVKPGKGTQAKAIEAVKGISFTVQQGEIFGFLGPNGAGKSTTQRMLTTLVVPTDGKAAVAGYDLTKQPRQVRERIGYVGQAGGTDDQATAYDNLLLQAQLYGQGRAAAQRRSRELIHALQLDEFADRPAKTYSGGQRRRLAIALALIHQPQILFLDEPTTGLDPQARAHLWDEIKKLRDTGTTVFLTTHYLDEADALADRLAIIDHGEIVAQGTPTGLKQQIAGDIIAVSLEADQAQFAEVAQRLQAEPYIRQVEPHQDGLLLYVQNGGDVLPDVLRLLDAIEVKPRTVSVSRPTLDDVFLRQTGRSLREQSFN